MNSNNFCHWLDGLLTLSKKQTLNKQDVALIREHLDLTLRPESLQFINGVTNLKLEGNEKVNLLVDASTPILSVGKDVTYC